MASFFLPSIPPPFPPFLDVREEEEKRLEFLLSFHGSSERPLMSVLWPQIVARPYSFLFPAFSFPVQTRLVFSPTSGHGNILPFFFFPLGFFRFSFFFRWPFFGVRVPFFSFSRPADAAGAPSLSSFFFFRCSFLPRAMFCMPMKLGTA